MADLNEQQTALPVKLSGADSLGVETNYVSVDNSGRITVLAQLRDAAGTAINLGQALMAGSIPVVISSNQSAIPASQSGTWTVRVQDASGASTVVRNSDLRAVDISDTSGSSGAITVGTTATPARVGGANLANRKNLTIYNNGTQTIYWGYANTVTTANGIPIVKGQWASWSIGANVTVFLISGSAGQDVRVAEDA